MDTRLRREDDNEKMKKNVTDGQRRKIKAMEIEKVGSRRR